MFGRKHFIKMKAKEVKRGGEVIGFTVAGGFQGTNESVGIMFKSLVGNMLKRGFTKDDIYRHAGMAIMTEELSTKEGREKLAADLAKGLKAAIVKIPLSPEKVTDAPAAPAAPIKKKPAKKKAADKKK